MRAIETVKLTGTLPKGNPNGLAGIAYDPESNYPDEFIIVAKFVPHKVTTDLDTGELTLTLRAAQIETITADHDRARITRLLTNAYSRRTGQGAALDFDSVEVQLAKRATDSDVEDGVDD